MKKTFRGPVSNNSALCGQIDAGMEGETKTVIGIVSSVQQRLTKNGSPFVTAVLEDLAGSIEISCWTELYKRTDHLWIEGDMLQITGKVRARNGGAQLICDQVCPCRPAEEESVPAELPKTTRLLITIAQTEDKQDDLARLHQIMDTIRRHPGEDEICLAIDTGDGLVKLQMPHITTGYCPELHQQLAGDPVGGRGV